MFEATRWRFRVEDINVYPTDNGALVPIWNEQILGLNLYYANTAIINGLNQNGRTILG